MKKDLSVTICFIASIICIGSLITVAFYKTEPMKLDLMSSLVGILSLLVTVLIGWQIFNFIYIKDEVKKLIRTQVEDSFNDLEPILKGMITLGVSKAFFAGEMVQAMDDNFIALESILKSRNSKLIEIALDVIMNNLYRIKRDMEASKKFEVFRDQKPKYISLIRKTDHFYKDELISFIEKCKEIEYKRDNHIRLFSEKDDLKKYREEGVID